MGISDPNDFNRPFVMILPFIISYKSTWKYVDEGRCISLEISVSLLIAAASTRVEK